MHKNKFYEKVENYEKTHTGKKKFKLNFRRKFTWTLSGVCLIAAASLIFIENKSKGFNFFWIAAGVALAYGIMFVYMSFEYKIKIDIDERKIFYKTCIIDIDEIETMKLKKIPQKGINPFQTAVDIITKEKKQYIFPLIMNKKLEFVGILKQIYIKKIIME